MEQQIAEIKAKLAALDERERWLVLLAGALLLFFMSNTFLLTPLNQKQKQLHAEIDDYQAQVDGVNQQIDLLAQTPVDQEASIYQGQLAALQKEIAAQQLEMAAIEGNLVLPEQMPYVLKDLMQSHQAIRLVSMETLAPSQYLEAKPIASQTADQSADLSLYKHAFSIVLSGRYLDLMQYAASLQRLPSAVLWESASLRTVDYPINELTLNLYTLSVDERWLSI